MLCLTKKAAVSGVVQRAPDERMNFLASSGMKRRMVSLRRSFCFGFWWMEVAFFGEGFEVWRGGWIVEEAKRRMLEEEMDMDCVASCLKASGLR